MFWVFSQVVFIQSQGPFFKLPHALPVEGIQNKLGGSTAGTDDWNRPKGYWHTTEHHAQDINQGDLPRRVGDVVSGRGVWQGSVGGEKLHCIVLFGYFFYYHFITIFISLYYGISLYFQLLNCSYLNVETSIFLLIPPGLGKERRHLSKWLCGISSRARLKTTIEASNISSHSRTALWPYCI